MQLRPKIRLPTLLIGVNLAVLIIAIVGIATVAIGLLLELGDDQGLARVRQGVAIAQNDVQRSGNEVLTTAQLLAERPTLARLLQTNDQVALEDFFGPISGHQRTGWLCNLSRWSIIDCGWY